MASVIPTWRNENGDIVHLRAGLALAANPFPLEFSSPYVMATGLAANGRVTIASTHDPSNQQYNAIDLGLFVDLPREVRARRVYATWDLQGGVDSGHLFNVICGVWNTQTSQWETPLLTVVQYNRSTSFTGHVATNNNFGLTSGNNNGQSVASKHFTEAPVVVPQEWYNLVAADPARVLRFVMQLNNNTANAITANWRAMFTVFGF